MAPYTNDTSTFKFEWGRKRVRAKPILDRIGFPDANQGRGGKDVVYTPRIHQEIELRLHIHTVPDRSSYAFTETRGA